MKNTKLKFAEFLNSKKVILTLICMIVVVICGFLGLFIFYHSTPTKENNKLKENQGRIEAYNDKDNELINIYSTLLEGSSFELGKGVSFKFGTDGKYSGFFDANNKKVKGYKYYIDLKDKKIMLHIRDSEEKQEVSYCMEFDKNGDIVLTHPNMSSPIILKF